MYEQKYKFRYKGNVYDSFGKIVITSFTTETSAVSIEKANSNIIYQAKKRLKLQASSKLLLNPSLIAKVS